MEKKLLNLKAKIQGIINTSEYRSKKLNGVLCSRADLEITVEAKSSCLLTNTA
jgi:hypothetical protein